MTPPLVIEASGSHRDVGRQVGEAGREIIEWGLDAYAERFEGLAGFGFAEAVERARDYLRPAEDYVPQAVDQLRGMAEAANVPFDHLFALNCSEEFTCRPTATGRPSTAPRSPSSPTAAPSPGTTRTGIRRRSRRRPSASCA